MKSEVLLQNFELLFRARGLSPAHGRIFGTLYGNGKMSQKELAKTSGYSLAAISVALDDLTRMGLILKQKEKDKREKVYSVNGNLEGVFRKFLKTIKDEHVVPFKAILMISGEKKLAKDIDSFEKYLSKLIKVK